MAWSPDNRLIATASLDRTVRLWAPASGIQTGELLIDNREDLVTAVAWSPDSRILATTAWDSTVRLWNAPRSPAWPAPTGRPSPATPGCPAEAA